MEDAHRPGARQEDAMNLIAPLLAAALGALLGTCVGVLVMLRNIRPAISETELADLRSRAETTQAALDASTGKITTLQEQVTQREGLIQRTSENLEKKQQELDA